MNKQDYEDIQYYILDTIVNSIDSEFEQLLYEPYRIIDEALAEFNCNESVTCVELSNLEGYVNFLVSRRKIQMQIQRLIDDGLTIVGEDNIWSEHGYTLQKLFDEFNKNIITGELL